MQQTGSPRARAYSYLRFSSPEQAKGASRRRQSDLAAKWAADNGLELDETLRDEGISAFRGKHRSPTAALGGFLERVRKGEIVAGSYLIVESLDRLSREEVVDALELFLGLTRVGIIVVSLADDHVYDRASLRRDSTQLIISIVIMARAHEESAIKSRRVGDAWARKRLAAQERSQAMTARCPGWLRLVGGPRFGSYELIPERAAVVRTIFEDSIAGDGRRTIVQRLNERGIECWGVGAARGTFWHDSYVAKILSSHAAYGRYDKGDVIDGYFPAAVAEETFWKAQAAKGSRIVGGGRTARHFANLLHGLAACPSCLGSMVYVDKGKRSRPVLRCSKAYAGAGCDMRTVVPYEGLEKLLVHCFAHFEDQALFAIQAEAQSAESEAEGKEQQRLEAVKRRDRLIEAIECGEPIPALRQRLDQISVDIKALEGEIGQLRARMSEDVEMHMDIELRIELMNMKIYDPDEEARYRGRSEFNARARRIIRRLVMSPGRPGFSMELNPGFEEVDTRMLADYGIRRNKSLAKSSAKAKRTAPPEARSRKRPADPA